MSLVEELRRVEQQVARRLQELEPLVAEYRDLRETAERIGGQLARAVKAPAAKGTKPAAVQRKRPARTRAAGAAPTSATPSASAGPPVTAKAGAAARPGRAAKPAAAGKRRATAKPAAPGKRGAAAKPTSNGRVGGKRDQDIMRVVTQQPGVTVAQVGKQLGVDPTSLYRVVRRLQAEGQISKEGRALKPAAIK